MGVLACLVGIGLFFTGHKLIGVSGSIASGGLAYRGYTEMKASKK
ncbi:hypothetical protein [Lacinutrix jangbogonensis]|nr:hypothetical protein [Lacinutrix jangbogonensis]